MPEAAPGIGNRRNAFNIPLNILKSVAAPAASLPRHMQVSLRAKCTRAGTGLQR
jgi:hypothetical protein